MAGIAVPYRGAGTRRRKASPQKLRIREPERWVIAAHAANPE